MKPLQTMLILAVRGYQRVLSPMLAALFGPLAGCRYEPTCSQYALDAVRDHGAFRGLCLAVKRLCRCHPWGGCGHDPVPPTAGRLEEPPLCRCQASLMSERGSVAERL